MSMTKCFKAILLEAYIELDGFNTPPTVEALAEKSWHVLARYPRLKTADLSKTYQDLTPDSAKWIKYWRDNPINAFIGGNSKKGESWFANVDGKLTANFSVEPSLQPTFHDFTKELIDFHLAKYAERAREKSELALVQTDTLPAAANEGTLLPYFPNLKIACGHFKTGTHDEVESMAIDLPNLNPEMHFLARASGNSMNGGKTPILDGDLLLFEFVTSTTAGSITGKTMAVEIQDESGDNQYLLRVVQKDKEGQYWLKANNPDYDLMLANESMRTLARLKQVIGE